MNHNVTLFIEKKDSKMLLSYMCSGQKATLTPLKLAAHFAAAHSSPHIDKIFVVEAL